MYVPFKLARVLSLRFLEGAPLFPVVPFLDVSTQVRSAHAFGRMSGATPMIVITEPGRLYTVKRSLTALRL